MKLKYPKFVSYLISHGDQISTAERREKNKDVGKSYQRK